MKPIDGIMPKKCVGCGMCCRKAPCSGAVRIYGNVTDCPALEYDGKEKRYFCSLMRLPGKLGKAYREELGAGTGCCSSLNTDRANIPPPEEKLTDQPLSPDLQVFLSMLGRQFMGPQITSREPWRWCTNIGNP